MKFKVGDRVVGNKKANSIYNVTCEGWQGEVVEVRNDDCIVVQDKSTKLVQPRYPVGVDYFDLLAPAVAAEKIIITTDGTKTTARMYRGKALVKSAEATCSPRDTFDFETGAALAVDRLLGCGLEEPAAFDKSLLTPGRFGRMDDGVWFVVVDDRLTYFTGAEGYDYIVNLNDSGQFPNQETRVDCVVDTVSLCSAKAMARCNDFVWVRPGAKFE